MYRQKIFQISIFGKYLYISGLLNLKFRKQIHFPSPELRSLENGIHINLMSFLNFSKHFGEEGMKILKFPYYLFFFFGLIGMDRNITLQLVYIVFILLFSYIIPRSNDNFILDVNFVIVFCGW